MSDRDLERRIAELERKVEELYRRLGTAEPGFGGNAAAADPRIIEALRSGNQIQAVKLYRELTGGRVLPPKQGRLRPGSYDREAALQVSRALGHNRLDVALRHYLR